MTTGGKVIVRNLAGQKCLKGVEFAAGLVAGEFPFLVGQKEPTTEETMDTFLMLLEKDGVMA